MAFLLEMMDSSYHVPRTLQESLRVPVLAAIPAILLDADRRARRRRQLREVFGAAAVTATVLLMSAAGYVYVNVPGFWRGDESAVTAPAAEPERPAAPGASTEPAVAPSAGLTPSPSGG